MSGSKSSGERICPRCATRYGSDVRVCSTDHTELMDLGSGDPLIGSSIADRFLVLDVAGKGGMGRVYRAVQLSVARVVALKLLPPQLVEREERAQRFAREARLTAKLRSEHTVTVYDFGQLEDGSLFLAMELIEGRSLLQILKEDGRLEPMVVARHLEHIARSLEEAHDAGLIHRDLKPGNVMIERTKEGERAKVLDFGIAKMIETEEPALTVGGAVFGTPHYMSPEQCQGGGLEVGPASDLYALGVMAFQLLTGELPFRETKLFALFSQHVSSPPPPLSAHLGDSALVRAWQRILDRCLAKRPEDRFASASELREALHRELLDPGPARPKQLPLRWIGGAMAVIAAIAIGFLSREPPIEEAPVTEDLRQEVPAPPPPARQPAWRGVLEASTNLDEVELKRTLAALEPGLTACAAQSDVSGAAAVTVVVFPHGRINVEASPRALETCVERALRGRSLAIVGGAFGSFRYVLRKR